jgi:hypothetical protein
MVDKIDNLLIGLGIGFGIFTIIGGGSYLFKKKKNEKSNKSNKSNDYNFNYNVYSDNSGSSKEYSADYDIKDKKLRKKNLSRKKSSRKPSSRKLTIGPTIIHYNNENSK